MVHMTTQRKQLSARTGDHPQSPSDGSADQGSWMGHPLPPGDLSNRRGLFLKQGRAPTDYRTVSEAHTRALSPILTEGRQRIAGEDPRVEISRA